MSFVTTTTKTKTKTTNTTNTNLNSNENTKKPQLSRTGSILLSPSKRRRLSLEDNYTHTSDKSNIDNKNVNVNLDIPQQHQHSSKELWEWTLSSASIAKCFVRDALVMSESQDGFDFYFLGSVPCRKVEICALVVGIQVFEKKVVYIVDDGTSVIECSHTPQQKQQRKPTTAIKTTESQDKPVNPLPTLKPITRIGGVIKVIGRVVRKFETRAVLVDQISPSDFGEQLKYWKIVKNLHETCYSRPGPFVIPSHVHIQQSHKENEGTPKKGIAGISRVAHEPPSPSAVIPSSPGTVTASSPIPSPVKPNPVFQSPPKLRHPSRLRSHNLTATAFRLYVKHFIDNAPEDSFSDNERDSDDDDDDDDDWDSNDDGELSFLPSNQLAARNISPTPTKSSKPKSKSSMSGRHGDRIGRGDDDVTPRPRQKAKNPISKTIPKATKTKIGQQTYKGFTLSYLRRIPELSLMAKRVVKQKAREMIKQQQQQQEKGAVDPNSSSRSTKPSSSSFSLTSSSSSKSQSSSSRTSLKISKASLASKKKRLFQYAICELLRDGSISLWEGPRKKCPLPNTNSANMLWKFNSTSTTTMSMTSNTSLFSNATSTTATTTTTTTSRSIFNEDEDMEIEELSEPELDEEAYISTKPEILSNSIENAIKGLTEKEEYDLINKVGRRKKELRGVGWTKEEILGYMKRDDRWAHIGEWNVEDGLVWMEKEKMVWKAVGDRWLLTE